MKCPSVLLHAARILGFAALLSTLTLAQNPEAKVEAQIRAFAQAKAFRSPVERKVSSQLLDEIAISSGHGFRFSPKYRSGAVRNQRGEYDLQIDAPVTPELLSDLRTIGVRIQGVYSRFHSITVSAPLAKVGEIAALPQVRHVRQPEGSMTNMLNEGDIAMASGTTRTYHGLTGAGIKVGVLSDSCRYLANLEILGQLPNVQVLDGQDGIKSDGSDTGEGTAMMQLVHVVAPSANLAFATAGTSQEQFADNIIGLALAGCKVITDDVEFYAEPIFQDGPVAQAVDFVRAMGVQYYSSAGNSGNFAAGTSGTWEGDFTSSKTYDGMPALTYPGGSIYNKITKQGKLIVLQWSDPMGASNNDYDLYVVDSVGDVISSSTSTQNGNDDPIEMANCPANGFIVVVKASGSARYIHLGTNRGRLEYSTRGAVYGHNCAAGAMSVAAARVTSIYSPFGDNQTTETFSSDGPRRVLYKSDGTPYTPGNYLHTGGTVRQKPDITGPDGVTTSVPGFAPFYGTSAAAPNVAAVGALLASYNPTLSVSQYRNFLIATAKTPVNTNVGGLGTIDALGASKYMITSLAKFSLNSGTVQAGAPVAGKVELYKTVPSVFYLSGGSLNGLLTFAGSGNVSILPNNMGATLTATAKYGSGGTDYAFLSVPNHGSQRTPLFTTKITPLLISSVKAVPQPMPGGATSHLQVQLSAPLAAPQTLKLSSSNPTLVPVPATYLMVAGQSLANIPITPAVVFGPAISNVTVTLGTMSTTTTVDVSRAKMSSVTLSPSTVYGGEQSIATVFFDGKVPVDTVLSIAATAPGSIALSSVTVPANSSYASFTVKTTPSTSDQVSHITVSDGSTTLGADLTVFTSHLSNLVLSKTEVFGGDIVTGTVVLDHAVATSGMNVMLGTSAPLVTGVPRGVNVPSGARTATFTIQTNADYFVRNPASVLATISGSGGGKRLDRQLMVDAPRLMAIGSRITTLHSGQTGVITVKLGGKAPIGGVTVSLAASPSDLVIPTSVTIPAGQSSADVSVTGKAVLKSTTVTITGTQRLTAIATATAHLALVVAP